MKPAGGLRKVAIPRRRFRGALRGPSVLHAFSRCLDFVGERGFRPEHLLSLRLLVGHVAEEDAVRCDRDQCEPSQYGDRGYDRFDLKEDAFHLAHLLPF